MFIIIVGGGKVGLYLVKHFMEQGHRVLLVEEDWEKVKEVRKKYGIEVVWGNGTEETVLEEAGIEDCDALVAVTEDDQDNLVICQLAERKYNIAKTYTRVNTPGNEKLFSWLGVNVAVSSASILAAMVEDDLSFNDFRNLLIKDQDKLKLIRMTVKGNSPSINKKIKDIKLPTEAVLVAILRGDNSLVPRGNTRLAENDVILALTRPELEEEMKKAFNG